jgi:hypothetical protein
MRVIFFFFGGLAVGAVFVCLEDLSLILEDLSEALFDSEPLWLSIRFDGYVLAFNDF